ncbi:MAG: hypothetical protein HOE23_05810, partial [Porticoccaceae bacterium]|nr:hypothetical protein [Porticoccaceae bacterium]
MARLIHLSGIFSLIFACQLNALEFDIETIAVSPKNNVDIIPFSNESSAEAKLLIIETPVINQLEKQMQELSNEPVRHIKVFQRRGSEWNLILTKALEDSMDLVDTITTPKGIQLVGLQGSKLLYLDENTSLFKPFLTTLPMFSGRSWGSSPVMEMFADINGDGFDDFLIPN